MVPLLTASLEKQSRLTRSQPDKQRPRFLTPTKTPQYLEMVETFLGIKNDLLAKHRDLIARIYATEETENICKMLQELRAEPDELRLRSTPFCSICWPYGIWYVVYANLLNIYIIF